MNELEKLKPELEKEIEKIAVRLRMDCSRVKLSQTKSDVVNASAELKGKIKLTTGLLRLWDSERKAVLFLIAHELVHLKYKEPGFRQSKIIFSTLYSNNARAIILLLEMRANLEAASALNLNELEKVHVQKVLKAGHPSGSWTKAKLLLSGYPSREMIASYTKRYTCLNEEAQNELLNEICISKKFKLSVLKTFNKHYLIN